MAEEKIITGRIDIDTDDEGLLAVLHFIPEDSGTEYTLQAVNRLINEKNIVYGINRKDLDTKLASLFSSAAEVNITLAEGDAPEQASAEEHVWADNAIPDDLKEDIERVLRDAAPPEMYRTSVDKVKKEKVVKKKGLFGKEKEEKVVDLVKLEKKIKLDINPDVVDAGWVESGGKIAEVIAGKSGKPGKDVFGKPILPSGVEVEFHTGHGIEMKGNTMIASDSGILRRGCNWIEILPFKSHDWNLELSKDKNTCLLNFNPGGAELSPPDPSEIIKRAEMLGCVPETLVSEEKLKEIINTAITASKELKEAVISIDEDSSFEIRVSDDKLKAELSMKKGRGNGKPLILKEVGKAIKNSGLKQLDLKKTQEQILEFYRGAETEVLLPICEGTGVGESDVQDLVYELEFISDAELEEIKKRVPSLSEEYLSAIESAADYPPDGITSCSIVKDNQIIASLPVNDVEKGVDVYGAELSAGSLDLSRYKLLENVKLQDGKIVSKSKGLLERFEKDGETAFRVRAHADSGFNVNLSADKMTVTLSATPAVGTGTPPSREEANRLLAEAGVTNGLNPEMVQGAVERCRNGEVVSGALVAMGKAPKNAGEAKLKFLIELAGGEAVSIDKTGRANYRNQNKMTSVKEGDIIAEIRVLEGESEDGWDVCGKSIAAKKLTPLNLDIGANIREEKGESGDTFLIAAKSGRIIYENNRLEVQENLFIKGDVDFGSGNIKFGGDVNIKGNVKSGFFVMAGGNINIGMNSEMSLLSSEKSIMVAQGIKGGGKALLRAKESIQLSFAERATLLAVDNITVKNAVFGCKLKCNGKLHLLSEKGYLVGGRIQAREGIEAQNIGSVSGSRTEVSFGQDYLVYDRIETEEKEINKIKNRLIKIDPDMRQAEKELDNKKLTMLRMEKVKLMKILEKRSMRVFALKERFEQHFNGNVTIRGEVFPGVVFESHGRSLEITKSEKSVKIVFNQETGMLEKVSLDK